MSSTPASAIAFLRSSEAAKALALFVSLVSKTTTISLFAVNDQALALVKKLNVTPEDNPTSKALTQSAEAERKKLSGLDGAAFDKAYVDNEEAYHKTVNSALSKTLIPDAENAELKSLLEKGLKVFESHLQHAESLATQLH